MDVKDGTVTPDQLWIRARIFGWLAAVVFLAQLPPSTSNKTKSCLGEYTKKVKQIQVVC